MIWQLFVANEFVTSCFVVQNEANEIIKVISNLLCIFISNLAVHLNFSVMTTRS